jgi:hypothetical protein
MRVYKCNVQLGVKRATVLVLRSNQKVLGVSEDGRSESKLE